MRLSWRLALMLVVAFGFAFPQRAVPAQQPVAVGEICFALAMRANGSRHEGRGTSLQQAEADAISKCRATALNPDTCVIVIGTPYCSSPPQPTNDHGFIDELRQKKVSVWNFGLAAAFTHILWLWHFSQKALAQPAKIGLGSGVTVIQAALLYLLGGDGDIGLLEIPIFALPLGLGEFVASVSFKRKSAEGNQN